MYGLNVLRCRSIYTASCKEISGCTGALCKIPLRVMGMVSPTYTLCSLMAIMNLRLSFFIICISYISEPMTYATLLYFFFQMGS